MAECIKCCMQHMRIDILNILYTIWEAVVPQNYQALVLYLGSQWISWWELPGLQLNHWRMNWASRMPKITWEVRSTHQAAKSHFELWCLLTELSHVCLVHIIVWWELVLVKISYWDACVREHHRQSASQNFTNSSKPNYPSFTAGETGIEKWNNMLQVIQQTNARMG